MPNGDGAAPAPPAGDRLALVRRHQQRAQARRSCRRSPGPSATSSASASSTWERSRPRARRQLVEERGAVLAQEVDDRLRARARLGGIRRRRRASAQSGACRRAQQRDRRRAHRRGAPLAAAGAPAARPQPRPGDAAGEAAVVEPGRLVAGEARRQDLASPRRRPAPRSLRAARRRRRARPALPCAHRPATRCQANRKRRKSRAATGSISARSRLTRVAVDAREQPALAPFVRRRRRA